MGVTVTITDTDMGWSDFKRDTRHLNAKVEAGLFGTKQASKGAWAELGTRKTPARPWMSIAADTGIETIFATGAKVVAAVVEGADAKAAYTQLGEVVVKLERDVILNNKVGGPALRPRTIKDKGSPKKLVGKTRKRGRSSHMVQAIKARVRVKK